MQAEISTHAPVTIDSKIQTSCCVFRLVENWHKENHLKDIFDKSSCNRGGIVQCGYCRIIAHVIIVLHEQKVLQTYEFAGILYFKTAHLDECK